WPGIVSIQATWENGTWHMCSGALIHPQWVLTVAQCFFASRDISIYSVVIGATDLSQPGPQAQLCRIQRLLLHQSYVAATGRNNIALLQLEQPVECSDYIQLGCVPDSSLAVPELKTCYLAGWRAAPAGEPTLTEPPRCSQQGVEAPAEPFPAGNAGLAGRSPPSADPSLPAQGDSGGPLVCKDNAEDNFWLVGLASWGRGCTRARRPGIFTSTQHFHAWIRAHAG
ncbi:ACRO protein, partial [Sitta europaea]|nr:ACRO protein [Sitta europaea]